MPSLLSSNYLSRRPVERAVALFAKQFGPEATIVDLGCGSKPYARCFRAKYIGVDPFPGTKADIIANAWETGLPDTSVDAVILNQSLEHIPETHKTIQEIERLLKPGGLVLVTVPQTVRNHGLPLPPEEAPVHNFDPGLLPYWNVDYWRFTKFGLALLFKNFHIERLEESNTYLTTLIQLWNYFLASFNFGILFAPFYLINNTLGALLDASLFWLGKSGLPGTKKFDQLIIRGLTLNIILIAKKP